MCIICSDAFLIRQFEFQRRKPDYELQTVLTAFCFDAEAVLKAFVRMSTGDDLRFGATNVYILLPMDDVTAVALQSMDYKRTEEKIHFLNAIFLYS